MGFKSNIDTSLRGFFFAPSGNDANSGETVEVPKLTIQAAINKAAALNPPPSAGANQALCTASQGGAFTAPIVMADSVNINGVGCSINVSAPIAVSASSVALFQMNVVSNFADNGIGIKIDGENTLGCDILFSGVFGSSGIGVDVSGTNQSIFSSTRLMNLVGNNSIGYNFSGTVNDFFVNVSQIVLSGTGAIGVNVAATMSVPINMLFSSVFLSADGTIFCICNATTADDTCVLQIGSLKKSGAAINTTGLLVKTGTLIVTASNIDVDIAIKVESGATLNISCDRINGDIIVDAGATLEAIIIEHSGTLTNNGTINGIINGERFGKFLPQVVLVAQSFNDQDPTGLDTPLQIEFGGAQGTVSDPIMISAAGLVTINQSGRYRSSIFVQYGRIGAGSASWLFFRGLKNGTQNNASALAKLDNANSDFPMQFETVNNLVEGDELTFELIRDSQGFDAGGLMSETPTPGDWLANPSAQITFIKE